MLKLIWLKGVNLSEAGVNLSNRVSIYNFPCEQGQDEIKEMKNDMFVLLDKKKYPAIQLGRGFKRPLSKHLQQ